MNQRTHQESAAARTERLMKSWLDLVSREAELVLPDGRRLPVFLRRATPPTFGEPLVRVEVPVLGEEARP